MTDPAAWCAKTLYIVYGVNINMCHCFWEKVFDGVLYKALESLKYWFDCVTHSDIIKVIVMLFQFEADQQVDLHIQ